MQDANKYSAQLFAARRRVFEAGLYQPLLEHIRDCALAYHPQRPSENTSAPLLLLDAGCGEGFFAANILQMLQEAAVTAQMCALDLSRDGVRLAAQHRLPGLCCLIGDLARLPLADHSVDILLNILSPANYGEFARVLRPGGLLIKVIPGPEYLQEVRQALGIAPQPAAEQNMAAELWQQSLGAGCGQTQRLSYRRSLSAEQAADFLQMSPLTFGSRQPAPTPAAELAQITIDLQILTATMQL